MVSIVKLSKLLHLVLLESCGDLSDPVGEDPNDLVEDCEHGLRNDL